MGKVISFRDLEVWQLGMNLVVAIYRVTEQFPQTERYGLTSQMRRAAVSIPSNVAEGHARRSDGAFLNHLRIALGSQAELTTEVEAAARLGFLSADRTAGLIGQIDQLRQMLHGLRRSVEHRRAGFVSVVTLGFFLCTARLF
jgi:four helix bundle protein